MKVVYSYKRGEFKTAIADIQKPIASAATRAMNQTADLAKAAGRPVKLMWSRNDDIRHGRMRPASHHRIRASHKDGRVVAFTHSMASVSVR